ncbi:hypothetical protein NA57DRAFT_77503 [Rhizodiscina lignyota]|uniref:Uncharacterized protein n=1 Tax=Rhizodiscina lignyota TaxID=1504668 RepID=A0A9P4IDW9_9PEZI|nr:hypothetical protein NA57DRAFT_77503 [Rhizodiscina lignyota]
MVPQMIQNCIPPKYERYTVRKETLEAALKEKYKNEGGDDLDFKVEHVSDRWSFHAPEELSKKQMKRLVEQIKEAEPEAAATVAENQATGEALE